MRASPLGNGLETRRRRARVDVDAVHRYLSEEAYWVRGRSRETVERLVRESTRVVAAYDGDTLIGFCRVMSDASNMAWLGDVFVVPSTEAAASASSWSARRSSFPEHRDLSGSSARATRTSLYAKFGFESPNERTMTRARPRSEREDHFRAQGVRPQRCRRRAS